MKTKKTTTYFQRKKLTLFLCLAMLFSLNVTKAAAWDAILGAQYQIAVEEVKAHIKGVTMASLKQEAIKMIAEEVDNMINDFTSIGTGIITDWEDYLLGIPERESAAFMNDYLSDVTKGRSSSRYRRVPAGKTLAYVNSYEGFGAKNSYEFALSKIAQAQEGSQEETEEIYQQNYEKYLNSMAKKISNPEKESPELDCTDEMRQNMFVPGENLDNFYVCTSGLNYAPLAHAHLTAIYQEELEKNRLIQKTKQFGGVTGKSDESGQTTVPATTVAALKNKSETLGMDVIANAQSIPEIITSVVVQAINRSINQGIGALKARGQRELSNIRRQITNKTRKEVQQFGPQAVFGRKTFYDN